MLRSRKARREEELTPEVPGTVAAGSAGSSPENEALLAELKNGSRPQEKLDAKAAVDAAQSELERSARDWDRAQTLYKNDDISTAQFDQYRTRWQSAEAALKSAKEREALVLAGPRTEQVAAQAAVVARVVEDLGQVVEDLAQAA